MACYFPKQAFLAPHLGINGKQIVSFIYKNGYHEISLPCGRCMGCRVDRTREWALRLSHEAKLHEFSSFITLTYDDDNIPPDYGLHKEHLSNFMRALRQWFRRKHPDHPPLRFYGVGEYGESTWRPHYHLIVYGAAFPDQTVFSRGSDPSKTIYTSPICTKLWGKGFTTHSFVSYANAAYCAGYVRKKITGKGADKHYTRINPDTGEIFKIEPEFALMSRRKGIGRDHITKYHSDVYPSDECIVDGHKAKPPRYYDKVMAELDASVMETVKASRKATAMLPAVRLNSTKDRLAVRREVAENRAALKRKGNL